MTSDKKIKGTEYLRFPCIGLLEGIVAHVLGILIPSIVRIVLVIVVPIVPIPVVPVPVPSVVVLGIVGILLRGILLCRCPFLLLLVLDLDEVIGQLIQMAIGIDSCEVSLDRLDKGTETLVKVFGDHRSVFLYLVGRHGKLEGDGVARLRDGEDRVVHIRTSPFAL